MAEVWVSYGELAALLGEDSADRLCRAIGGLAVYVPFAPDPRSRIAHLLPPKAFEHLCSVWGGDMVTVPNRRRMEPHKDRIIRLLERGGKAQAIACEVGVTERYVREVARLVKLHERQVQYSLF